MAENIATINVLSNLGNLLEAGVSKARALEIALRGADPSIGYRFKDEVITEGVSQINTGSTLSAELAKLDVFNEYELTILEASESAGSLEFGIHAIVDEYILFRTLGA